MAAEDDSGDNQTEPLPIAPAFEELLVAKVGELVPRFMGRFRRPRSFMAMMKSSLEPPSEFSRWLKRSRRTGILGSSKLWVPTAGIPMLGLLAGWTTAIALAAGAVIAGIYDQPIVGGALAAASATGMVRKLIQGRSEKPEQQAERPKQVAKGRESRLRGKRR
jgi:hypothetical protein